MASPDPKSVAEVERRRRAAELLGEVLPNTSADDTDEGWAEKTDPDRDEDFLRDVPPHHG